MSSSSQNRRAAEPTFRRWNVNARTEVGAMKAGADDSFNCAAFSPDGGHVLVGGPGGFLKLWSW